MKSFVALPVALFAVVAASLPAHAWFLPGDLNLERTNRSDVVYQLQPIEVPQATAYGKPAAEWDDVY